jgi:septal ring factor EnvC (AmiA/AmiB activator)
MKWRGWLFVLGFFLGGAMVPGIPSLQAAQTNQLDKDLTQKKQDLRRVRKELSVTKEKEQVIRGKESSVLENLSAIETELYKKGKELKQMERQLGKTKERLQQAEGQIDVLNQGIERTRQEFFSRLTALYKMGKLPPETFLLTSSSSSYLDALRTDKYLRVIVESDAQIVETFRTQRVLKERYQEVLLEDRTERERAIAGVGRKKEEVKKARAEQRALLKSIRSQKVVYQKVISELEARAKNLQTFVDKLEKEKSTLAYARPKSGGTKANLMPPLRGRVISHFKERGQNGIEIKAPMGAEVHAILAGRVLYADWFKGFGNVIIIDHGDHLFTVSGYASELLKKAGDTVSQGEPIALVGSAGSLKGPCLYFEIRNRGKPEDPTDWIPQLEKVVSLPEDKEKAKKEL